MGGLNLSKFDRDRANFLYRPYAERAPSIKGKKPKLVRPTNRVGEDSRTGWLSLRFNSLYDQLSINRFNLPDNSFQQFIRIKGWKYSTWSLKVYRWQKYIKWN